MKIAASPFRNRTLNSIKLTNLFFPPTVTTQLLYRESEKSESRHKYNKLDLNPQQTEHMVCTACLINHRSSPGI